MQLKKIVAAGSLATLMAGSSIAFAAGLADYPSPFVSATGSADFLVVVGATALPEDVVGAIDVATRLGGQTTRDVVVGATAGGTQITGEGKEVATVNTKLYLDDSLGKSGVRTTMTKDDMPTLLASGTLQDADAGTTHPYTQFIYLTPSSTTSASYSLQFEKPGSSTAVDPTYAVGRFSTSPTASDYFYRTQVVFEKDVNGSTAVGEKVKLFGREYTVHSDTSTTFTNSTSDKLVLSGGAETRVFKGEEKIAITLGGKTYEVTFIGASDASTAVIRVGADQQSIAKGKSKKVGDLDVYVDDVYRLATDNQKVNSVKLLLGAEKLIFTHATKVKKGDSEDSVDGTFVNHSASSGKLSTLTIYHGGHTSSDDVLKLGGRYDDNVWKTFGISFPSISPDTKAATRTTTEVTPSGSNLLQVTYTDDRGNRKTINWAYKSASTGQAFTLADSSGNRIRVVENETVARDEYFVVDAGDFTHLFRLASTSIDSTSSSNVELVDQFSGVTTKVVLGSDNKESKVLDGQTYRLSNVGTTSMKVNWGDNSDFNITGDFVTAFPRLKGRNGEYLVFYANNATVLAKNGTKINLPTGAVTVNLQANGGQFNLTSVAKEDGTASACAATPCANSSMSLGNSATFTLGRTATGGVIYNMTVETNGSTTVGLNLSIVGATGAAGALQPGLLMVEEKDSNSDQYSAWVTASSETSGSDNVAIPSAPEFTATEDSDSLGSDSTITHYVDIYGLWAERRTSGQDTLKLYYPDDQVLANLFVLATGAAVETSAASKGTTVKEAQPVKTAVARLDSEVTSADKTTKNLVLVGGPAVNTLVADLGTQAKTKNLDWYRSQGAGTTLIDLVADAFTSGKSALVVAGHSAPDTRAATGVLQQYDANADKLKASTVVLKNVNGVWTVQA